jgi:sugar phosphate isomerase/epimerase
MRLGGYYCASTIEKLDAALPGMDRYGLSALSVGKLDDMTEGDADVFGAAAAERGVVPGEHFVMCNLLHPDEDERRQRIDQVRRALVLGDRMGCRCVVSLVGTLDPSNHPLAPHPWQHTAACRVQFRETVLRIVDGLDLSTVRYGIEPWHNTFFYQPEDIAAFLDAVDHPRVGLHLDQMNMVDQRTFFDTTGLIERTFDLLADRIISIHLKDIGCDHAHLFLKWDEVPIGTGTMDYATLLPRIATLDPDMTCYCEHWQTEEEYAREFATLHRLAGAQGLEFKKRG